MAIAAIPFVGLTLLPHSAGGVILAHAGSYLAGTYVSAPIVAAFTTASSVLAQMSAGASTIAATAASIVANPVTLGIAAVAVVAVGTYCYFYGIPAPIAATLEGAGLAKPMTKGLMVALPKLAVALVLLGGAGYVVYRLYSSHKARRSAIGARPDSADVSRAKARSWVEEFLGAATWTTFGDPAWAAIGEAGRKAVHAAEDAVELSAKLASEVSCIAAETAQSAASFATQHTARRFGGAISRIEARLGWFPKRFGRLFGKSPVTG